MSNHILHTDLQIKTILEMSSIIYTHFHHNISPKSFELNTSFIESPKAALKDGLATLTFNYNFKEKIIITYVN